MSNTFGARAARLAHRSRSTATAARIPKAPTVGSVITGQAPLPVQVGEDPVGGVDQTVEMQHPGDDQIGHHRHRRGQLRGQR